MGKSHRHQHDETQGPAVTYQGAHGSALRDSTAVHARHWWYRTRGADDRTRLQRSFYAATGSLRILHTYTCPPAHMPLCHESKVHTRKGPAWSPVCLLSLSRSHQLQHGEGEFFTRTSLYKEKKPADKLVSYERTLYADSHFPLKSLSYWLQVAHQHARFAKPIHTKSRNV